jgi:hypothetical protein
MCLSQLKPMGYTWSYLARDTLGPIGHLVSTWQPFIGSSVCFRPPAKATESYVCLPVSPCPHSSTDPSCVCLTTGKIGPHGQCGTSVQVHLSTPVVRRVRRILVWHKRRQRRFQLLLVLHEIWCDVEEVLPLPLHRGKSRKDGATTLPFNTWCLYAKKI